jgi:hypothetical protein
MQLEIVRELVRALEDPDDGILAQLVGLPKDAGDSVTTDIIVVDGTRDDQLAKGEQVQRMDAEVMLLVTPDGPTVTSKQNIKAEYAFGTTPIAITVVHRGNGAPAKKVQDVEYLLRACVLVVKTYFGQREEGRIRNEVTLLRTAGLQYGLVADDGLGALGAVVFTVDALDKRAQRTV